MGGDYTPLAHGIGGRQDLPVPLETAIVAAVAALIVSFVVLAWTVRRHDASDEPMPAAPVRERPVPRIERLVDSAGWRVGLRVIGMLLFAYTLMVGVFGQDLEINPIFGIFYVWIWVGVPIASLLFGRVWKAISPFRLISAGIARVSGGHPDEGVFTYPSRLGYWPAALGLLAFVWMELVYTHNVDLSPVRLWCGVYLGVMIIGGWASLTIIGMMLKIVPFLVWYRLYAPFAGRTPVPGLADLRWPAMEAVAFVTLAAGVGALAVTVWVGDATAIRAAATVILVGTLAFGATIVAILNRLVAALPPPVTRPS